MTIRLHLLLFNSPIIVTFVILLASYGTSANSILNTAEQMTYVNHFFKYDTVSNMPSDCGGNAYDLYLKIRTANGFEPKGALLVHVFYVHNSQFILDNNQNPISRALIPRRSRTGADWWSFHAFLVVNGAVLDQYFTNKPVLMEFEEYLSEMWGPENITSLKFQVVPAAEYGAVANRGYVPDPKQFPIVDHANVRKAIDASLLKF